MKEFLSRAKEAGIKKSFTEAEDSNIRIFLTNLGKYNEGELIGEWVDLPVDDFDPILERIGINDEYEEWFITDYEAPFSIGEYDNIYELNEIAEAIENFSDFELEILDAFKDHGYDMDDAIQRVRDDDYLFVEGDTEEDLAYNYINMVGSFDDAVSRESKEYYFDYEAFGRDLVLGGDFSEVEDVVDINDFADKDTAIAIFGDYGEDLPSDEDIAKYQSWIDLFNKYDNGELSDEEIEKLEEQGFEFGAYSITAEGNTYDIDVLKEVVEGDYVTESGYRDYEGNIYNLHGYKELGEYFVDVVYGGLSELPEDEVERYFDYEWYGKTLAYDFDKIPSGWVSIN